MESNPTAAAPAQPLTADGRPPKGSRYAPVSVWGYLGIGLLLSIPVVSFILVLVWACGGANNQSLRNIARAILIWYGFLTVGGVAAALLIASGVISLTAVAALIEAVKAALPALF